MGTDKQLVGMIREIFTKVRNLPSDERANVLADLCGGNPDLLNEVESLLQVYDSTDGLLQHDASGASLSGNTNLVGTEINGYHLLERIGEGGFGEVFRAEQTVPMHREVALKIIKLGMDTKNVVARFEAEREAMARMNHTGIAQVYDAGITESGRPYFVMELVRGIPFIDYCDQHRLSLPERLTLFCDICEAVQHAHQKGILHRDLKPSNILVFEENEKPLPKIIDFGVAKSLRDPLTAQTLATLQEMLIGTPLYMSPEQLDSKIVDIDTRADIYSLGIILYELVAGITPMEGELTSPLTIAEMRQALVEKAIPLPSRHFRSLGPRTTTIASERKIKPPSLERLLRGDLDWVVMKAIERERDRRYADVGTLAKDLVHYLNHEPVSAGPPSTVYRVRKFVRRHHAGVVLVVGLTLVLIVGLLVSLIGFAEARRERDRARAAEAQSERLAQQESEQRERAVTSAKAARAEKETAKANLRMAEISQIEHHLDKGEVGPALVLLEEQRADLDMKDSRSLEWRHLWWRAHQGHRFTLRGHVGGVNHVAFVPDGSLAVSAGNDGTVRLWRMDDGVEQAVLMRQKTRIIRVAVSPDGKTIAWANRDGGLVLWDRPSKRVRHTIRTERILSLSFSPDSRLIAGGCVDGCVRLWNTDTAEQFGSTVRANDKTRRPMVAFCPDGRTLGCANLDSLGSMTVLDVNDPNVRTQLPGHPTWIRALAVSADGMLVSGGGTPSVKVWDVGGAREKAEVTPSVSLHTTLAVSPDGEWIAVGGWSGTIEVRELATGRTKQFGHIGTISSLAFSPDGSILASTGEDGTVKTWDFRREHDRVLVQGSQRTFSHLAYSPDGRLLAIANRVHGTLELREVPSGRLLRSNTAADMRRFAAFSPDGRILVGGPSFLWDVDAEQELQSPSFAFGRAAAFSPDNRILAVGGGDGQKGFIELWDWKASKKLAELQGHSRSVRAVSMSPDGKTLASASAQGNFTGEVILWEVSSGQRKHTLEHACVRVAYSPDGKLLASGSRSGGIALWDPDTGRLLKDIVGHTRYTGSLAFVPDGKTIISCNMLKGVSLWDVEKGIERATLSRSELSVSSIAISPDGKTFATVSREGSLDIWRTASAAEVRAQSAWFDPRLRLARKYEADARMFQKGLRPKDALRASSLAEQLYQELASEFPDRHPVVYESGTARQ